MNILLLCGSFRAGSLNAALLAAAAERLTGHDTTTFPIRDLPFYDTALDGDGRPPVVADFLAAVAACDGIVIAGPEYNHSVTAVLKNAIDWASRPAFASPLAGKPYTVLSATPSPVGGVHGQAHLKHILDSTLSVVYPAVTYALGQAHEKIVDGQLVDEQAQRRLDRHMAGFLAWLEGQGDRP